MSTNQSTKLTTSVNPHLLPDVFIGNEDYSKLGSSMQSSQNHFNSSNNFPPKKKAVGKLAPIGSIGIEDDNDYDTSLADKVTKLSNTSQLRKHGQLAPINF